MGVHFRTVAATKTPGLGRNSRKGRESMYAIVFDLDTKTLEQVYPNDSWRNTYQDMRRALEAKGFDRQQGSTYFGNDAVDAVTCVLAVQALKKEFNWFAAAVRDIRMLRIEENNDLGPALEN